MKKYHGSTEFPLYPSLLFIWLTNWEGAAGGNRYRFLIWESADTSGSSRQLAAGRPPSCSSAHVAARAPQCPTATLTPTGRRAHCGGAGESLAAGIYRDAAE